MKETARRLVLIAQILVALMAYLPAQNLIPNPGFEEITCPENVINSILVTDTWYAINSDAYWLHTDCPVAEDIQEAVRVMDVADAPLEGDGYITLEGAFRANGYFTTEGVGVELTEPLKAGVPYYFEMNSKHLRVWDGPGHPPFFCADMPTRFMEVHVADEPIEIRVESDAIGIAIGYNNNANLVLVNETAAEVEDFQNNTWYYYANCFIASGGESHIAISGNNYRSTEENNCYSDTELGALFIYGHSLDDVGLYEVPTEIDTISFICEDGGWVDLADFVQDPIYSAATYLWDDGCTEPRRVFRREGVFEAEMFLPCVTVPIVLEVRMGNDCRPVAFNDEMPRELTEKVLICTDEPAPIVRPRELLPDSMQAIAQLTWQDGGKEETRTITEPGIIEVWVQVDCFSFPLLLEATSQLCGTKVFVPNVFSPNLDGINDRLQAFISTPWELTNFKFRIFDRWGALVFESTDPSAFWDGRRVNQDMPQGVYAWALEYELNDGEATRKVETGDVLLLR